MQSDVAENLGWMAYVPSKWVISCKNHTTVGFLEAFLWTEQGALE